MARYKPAKMKDMNKRRLLFAAVAFLCVLVATYALDLRRLPGGAAIIQRLRGKATVSDRVAQYGPGVQARWQPYFQAKGMPYPPQKLLLVGLKREKQLQVYAADADGPLKLIRTFPILRQSGKLGPKLRYGDYQVPEGFYRIESLNPNSAYHLALRVNYPNQSDKAQAEKENRTELGGDIMIHGSTSSVGCLAMGDEAAEELFVLAALVGRENIEVILTPIDFRVGTLPEDASRPEWVKGLYRELKAALIKLPAK